MSAKQILSIAGILLVLGLIAWGVGSLSRTMLEPTIEQEQTSPILGGTATSSTSYEYVENKPYYTIEATYPRKTLLQDPGADLKARTTMEQSIADGIAQFKTDGNFANLTAEDIQLQGLGTDRKYALGYDYKEYKGASTVSYVYLVYQDTLGAHPNAYYSTFTFDAQGNRLELADLFASGTRYLDQLSSLAYAGVVAELTSRGGEAPGEDQLDTIRMGTAPSPEALQFFYVSGNTLHLLFPPYQVAAYAAGSFDISIPLSSLSGLKSEFK